MQIEHCPEFYLYGYFLFILIVLSIRVLFNLLFISKFQLNVILNSMRNFYTQTKSAGHKTSVIKFKKINASKIFKQSKMYVQFLLMYFFMLIILDLPSIINSERIPVLIGLHNIKSSVKSK